MKLYMILKNLNGKMTSDKPIRLVSDLKMAKTNICQFEDK